MGGRGGGVIVSWFQSSDLPLSETLNRFANYFEMLTEIEMMKERFSKLLLGEDMSGSGKGVCTAVTVSNAITNLYGKRAIYNNF